MLYTTNDLRNAYPGIRDIRGKAMRERRDGNLYRLKDGFYSDACMTGMEAGAMLDPHSYISFQTVLMYGHLVPESAPDNFVFATVSFAGRKPKIYSTDFGNIIYRSVPQSAFHVGLIKRHGSYCNYYEATKEKALMDLMYRAKDIDDIDDMEDYLLEDLRMEYEDLLGFDLELVRKIEKAYPPNRVHGLFSALLNGWKEGVLPHEHSHN